MFSPLQAKVLTFHRFAYFWPSSLAQVGETVEETSSLAQEVNQWIGNP